MHDMKTALQLGLGTLKQLTGRLYKMLCPPASPIDIERQLLHSRLFTSVGYDASRKLLHVEFHNGLIYQAKDISIEDYEDIISAADPDPIFQKRILHKNHFDRIGQTYPIY